MGAPYSGGGGPPRYPPGGPRESKRSNGGLPLRAGGGERENLRLGTTMDTLMTAPSTCPSCMCAMAASACEVS
jgi:hypothetical protein